MSGAVQTLAGHILQALSCSASEGVYSAGSHFSSPSSIPWMPVVFPRACLSITLYLPCPPACPSTDPGLFLGQEEQSQAQAIPRPRLGVSFPRTSGFSSYFLCWTNLAKPLSSVIV